MNNDRVKELDQVLTNWINEELENERIIVKDLRDDLFDGQEKVPLFDSISSNKNSLTLKIRLINFTYIQFFKNSSRRFLTKMSAFQISDKLRKLKCKNWKQS